MIRRTMLLTAAMALATTLGTAAPAGAATLPKEYYEVDVVMPAQLEADAADIWRITPRSEVRTVGTKRILALWMNNLLGGKLTTNRAIAIARDPSITGAVLVDRPLTATELKTFTARPLFVDGDVLVVAATHPLCGSGTTADVARRIVTGEVTDWSQAGVDPAAWPHGSAPFVLLTPSVGRAQTHFGAAAVTASSYRTVEAQMATTVVQNEGFVAVARYSGVRHSVAAAGACLVPIDGVAPTDETVRTHAYVPSWTVSWVTRRTIDAMSRRHLVAFAQHLFGPRGRRYLTTGTARDHVLPS